MLRITKTLAAGAVLAATLALGVGAGAALGDQPHMQAALEALKIARAELVAGAPNKGGHRGEAIRLTNAAIAEVERAIAFDRTH